MDSERRKLPRQRVLKGARIVTNDGFSTFSCTVRNLTDAGAQLKVAGVIGIPDQFRLVFDDGRSFACEAVWKRENEIGVQFV